MARSFSMGGIHPPDNKISRESRIEKGAIPATVIIPMSQHIGAPAVPVVSRGDKVKVGQLIGRAQGFVSANVHSSVSGTVKSIDLASDISGRGVMSVVVETEGDQWADGIENSDKIIRECLLTPAEIVAKIADAGIVGLGGAAFPTHVKLTVPEGKKAEYLLINGSECEPYLTSDYRLMVEQSEKLLLGAKILLRALGARDCIIGIEANKPEAIEALRKTGIIVAPEIEIAQLKTQYPQGGEKQLIDSLLHRKVPSGKLPIDVGVVVQNVGTAIAVYEAVQHNKPLVERVVTVTGKSLSKPVNILARIGTPIEDLVKQAGGIPADTGKIISGGPMMGRAVANTSAPITKGTSGITLMPMGESLRQVARECIRCAKCVGVCPMGLEPYLLSRLSGNKLFEDADKHYITDCIECGSCSYTCPSNIPLLDYIRLGKAEVMRMKRMAK